MARDYGKITTASWGDPKLRALPEDARNLFRYLCTAPHSTAAGCYHAPLSYIAHDLQWTPERVREGFAMLSEKPFATYDEATCLVRLPGWWDENPLDSENIAIHAVKLLRALPECAAKVSAINGMISFQGHKAKASSYIKREFPNGPITPPEGFGTPEMEMEPEPDIQPSAGAPAPPKLKDQIFGPCLDWLASRTGKPADKLRSMVGKWCSRHGDGATLEAMTSAERNCPQGDPVSYIERILKPKGDVGPAETPTDHTDAEWLEVLERWKRTRTWPPLGAGYGTEPGYSGCIVPAAIFAKCGVSPDGLDIPACLQAKKSEAA